MKTKLRTLYENGKFLDVVAGGLLPEGTRVAVVDGIIEAVGLEVRVHPGDQVVDLGGRFVTPGLINAHAHVHLAMPAIAASAATFLKGRRMARSQILHTLQTAQALGVTTLRDGATEDLGDSRRLMELREAGALSIPRIIQAVVVSMEGSCWTRRRGVKTRLEHALAGLPHLAYHHPRSGAVTFPRGASERQVREAVDTAVARGALAIKLYDQREALVTYQRGAPLMGEDHLRAAVDQAHRHGLPAVMHHFSVESFRRGVAAGVDTLVHLPIDGPLDEDDVARCRDGGIVLEPTLSLLAALSFSSVLETFEPARMAQVEGLRGLLVEELDRFWLEPLARYARRDLGRVSAGRTRLLGFLDFSGAYRYHAPMINHGVDNLRRLFAARCPLAAGNDGGIPPLTAGMVGLELAHLIALLAEGERPFTAADALRAVTVTAAQSLSVPGLTGTLTAGSTADMVIYGEDPLLHPGVLGKPPVALIVEGHPSAGFPPVRDGKK